jgi:pimeloyl-ACP methyl ester carboxylesterase
VLLISGSGAQDRDETVVGHKPFLVLADHLTRAGLAVLRVDDRGVGGSTGDRATATTEDYAEDVLAGVTFLKGRPEIDSRRIGLIGHSEGGIIAPMAATRSGDVAFVVLLAGTGVPGAEVMLRQVELISRAHGLSADVVERAIEAQRDLFHLLSVDAGDREVGAKVRELIRIQLGPDAPEETVEEAVAQHLEMVRLPWFRFFLDYDPRPALREVDVPVLALCGGKDLQVEPEQNLTEIFMALAEGGNDRFAIEELPGLNHMFQRAETGSPMEYYEIEETINPAALDAVSGWILERFGDGSYGE